MPAQSPVTKCPNCNVPMGVKLVSTGAAGETTKVIYACVICAEETERQYKMPEPPPPSPSPRRQPQAAVVGMPVTPNEMRQFAAECLRWAEDTKNASQRDIMIRMARGWVATASVLERCEDVLPDLRGKLD